MNLRAFGSIARQPKLSPRQRDLRDQMLSMGSNLGEPSKWVRTSRSVR